jgi:hypothetical protein
MDLVCTTQRVTNAPNSDAGYTATTATILAACPCNLGGASGENERTIASRLSSAANWWLTLPYGSDVAFGDIVTISGAAYRVVYAHPADSYSTARRALVEAHT